MVRKSFLERGEKKSYVLTDSTGNFLFSKIPPKYVTDVSDWLLHSHPATHKHTPSLFLAWQIRWGVGRRRVFVHAFAYLSPSPRQGSGWLCVTGLPNFHFYFNTNPLSRLDVATLGNVQYSSWSSYCRRFNVRDYITVGLNWDDMGWETVTLSKWIFVCVFIQERGLNVNVLLEWVNRRQPSFI